MGRGIGAPRTRNRERRPDPECDSLKRPLPAWPPTPDSLGCPAPVCAHAGIPNEPEPTSSVKGKSKDRQRAEVWAHRRLRAPLPVPATCTPAAVTEFLFWLRAHSAQFTPNVRSDFLNLFGDQRRIPELLLQRHHQR